MSPYRHLRLRYPYEVYLLVFSAVSSLPSAVGIQDSPNSISSQLSSFESRVWSISLLAGAIIALAGIFWPTKNAKSQITGLTLEQVGLVLCGFAALIYAFAIFMSVPMATAAVPLGLILGFAFASFAQANMIHSAVKSAVRTRAEKVRG